MKLKHLQIENYRSIKELYFEFPLSNILVLVGPNNAGKSNIIRAIDLVCGEGWSSADKLEDHDYYRRDKTREIFMNFEFSNDRKVTFSSKAKWADYFDEFGERIFSTRGSIKDDFPCTYLGADRTFDKHLSFYDWTLIGKIRKSFHKKALAHQEDLKRQYDEIAKIYDRMPGFLKFKNDFTRFFCEMQADTNAQINIDFKPFTPSNYFKNLFITAYDPTQSEDIFDLAELGEGSRNTILLALLRSYAVNFRSDSEKVVGLLALEEPEIFLHPQARRHLFKVLREIAESGIQVVLSTHSTSFVDTEYFDSIGQVYKVTDETSSHHQHTSICRVSKADLVQKCIETGVPIGKVTLENISEFYKTTSNARLNESFFARLLVLVEGETEELALPEYLQKCGIDCDLQGVSIIAVGGKNQLPKYWRLFSLYSVPIVMIFDNDDDENGTKNRSNKNLAECFGLSQEDIKSVSGFSVKQTAAFPGSKIIILEKDFETVLRNDYGRQSLEGLEFLDRLEGQARNVIKPIGNQNKGQIARFIARELATKAPGFTPEFVKELAKIISEHVVPRVNTDLSSENEEAAEDDFLKFE